ncbi:hypothetical protein E6C67_08535 [Azospirillum sp. TSA2s]|uniref:beta barrel domain-containing protein n=1 Tax=Azospirillum sp. TSA2s TaxID=709810 RepID=UPI0010AAEAAD|nr:hypothetical protein [Azospirillum sp. TSA2s]QCG93985.1 hypothetical protein E6C67_08535 [Azospirillum sp. TSA2s]
MAKLTVGQMLWYVPNAFPHVAPGYITVQSVGRKWATVSGVDIKDWRLDIGSLRFDAPFRNPGWVYETREQWEVGDGLRLYWSTIRVAMRGDPKEGVSIDAIYQAASLLGIELPARSDTGETK